MVTLPPELARPVVEDGEVVSQVVYDLTLYLERPTVADFYRIVDLYRRSCPPDRVRVYAISETPDWDDVNSPLLTRKGVEAQARGETWPFCAPVRSRIEDRRPFVFQLWDGEPSDSYSLNFRGVREHYGAPSYWFVRFIFPLSIDCLMLRALAEHCATELPVRSGHGGLCLSYSPWDKERGFTLAYRRARRWWGLDIEDLNQMLPLMVDQLKGAQWITVIGNALARHPAVGEAFERGVGHGVSPVRCHHGLVVTAGAQPSVGDQHAPDPGLAPYCAVATAIEPITVQDHPDFVGEHFPEQGNTVGWFHRFTEPEGWR